MSSILSSASKLVFLALAATACAGFLWAVVTGRTTLDIKDFMVLASMAFGYYFGKAGDPTQPLGGK